MQPDKSKHQNIDDYIVSYPLEVQESLKQMREAVRNAAPETEEIISYQMPAYREQGVLVYFGAFKNHIGFFPTASAIQYFQEELASFKTSKGTIQFPYSEPLPLDLITRIVRFRVQENKRKVESRKRR